MDTQVVWGTEESILPSCPKLTKLIMSRCVIKGRSLAALSAATRLLHLQLFQPHTPRFERLALEGPVLQKLTRLTHLSLTVLSPGDAASQPMLQHISCLVNLKELVLAYIGGLMLDSTHTPGFSSLTALTTINLREGDMDPAVLATSTQLRHLGLQDVALVRPDPSTAAAALLSCIARMPHLQSLQLCPGLFEWPAEAAAYTALTANCSELQHLQLAASLDLIQPPDGAWAAMFPAGRVWPKLKVLGCLLRVDEDNSWLPDSALTAVEVERLVSCCPSLQSCELRVCNDVPLAPLAALTGLTSLRVAVPTKPTFTSLAQLQSLRQLMINVKTPLCPSVLVRLTRLQDLSSLQVSAPGELGDETYHAFNINFYSHRGGSQVPRPVWLQLQQHCANYPVCHPSLLRALPKLVDEQWQAIEQLQQQGQEQRQELSAARSEVAELGGRVQALEAQLAQVLQALQGIRD